MPFNGSGTFSIVNTFVPNTTILSAAVNQNFTDIATGLSDCLTRDGQAGMTAAFKAISGSVSAPGISFNSDATSGLFLSASGIVGLVSHSLGMLLNTALFTATAATVQAGGSNYAVGDTITATGGTAVSQPIFTVATLSGSAVATVTVSYPGFYSAKPSNPVSQGSTSGIGTGCTLNVTYNDPTSSDYRALFTDQSSALLWQKLGASSFLSGLMNSPNGLALATGIGSSNIATVLGSSFIIPPGGVLSPVSSTTAPIPATDATAITRIYWTPIVSNLCPIYNGTNVAPIATSQIFCDLTAGAQASGGIYDVYMFLNAGVATLGFSPSWSAGTSGSVTLGSCARGTGAGGTALTLVDGIKVNAVAQTLNNGATTYTLPINQGTYLGSVYVNSTAGQINCHVSYGQSRVWGLWNCYNRHRLILQEGDTTLTWAYTTLGYRAANNDANNNITLFSGLAEEIFDVEYQIFNTGSLTVSATSQPVVGIGYNSTSVPTGFTGSYVIQADSANAALINVGNTLTAKQLAPRAIGINRVTALENGNASNASTFHGGTNLMMLTAAWMG
jgi:hypothetical protein